MLLQLSDIMTHKSSLYLYVDAHWTWHQNIIFWSVMNAELTDERWMGSLLAFEYLLPSHRSAYFFSGRNDWMLNGIEINLRLPADEFKKKQHEEEIVNLHILMHDVLNWFSRFWHDFFFNEAIDIGWCFDLVWMICQFHAKTTFLNFHTQ